MHARRTLYAVRQHARSFSVAPSRSAVYVLPVDPRAPPRHTSVGVDAESLWSATPAAAAPKPAEAGTTHIFYDTPSEKGARNVTALTSLGDKFAEKAEDERREVIRKAVGSAVKQVRALGEGIHGQTVFVDASADPHAAAVATHLAQFEFTLKTKPPSRFNPNLKEAIPEKLTFQPLTEHEGWKTGAVYARAQNLARTLTELPGNMMTPTAFVERIEKEFSGVPNVKIIVRDEAWAAKKGMNAFLSVTKGTSQPAKLLEIHYNGGPSDAQPILLVGKGVTFDTGGISLKPSAGMKLMRGDMGGAAAVCSAALAVAQLGLPVNLKVLTPLCENMPGPSANKPGDIVYAMNGKSIEVDDTDAEGRLVLADALYYGSTTFKPHTIVDVATLTGAMSVALGEAFTGVFTNSDSLWQELDRAGLREHDRFWRMPLDDEYGPQIHSSNADLCNIGGRAAGSCTAALFLKAFVDGVDPAEDGATAAVRWAHLDIAGTMETTRGYAYQDKGLTGRPTRALIEFVKAAAS
ncbi:hypothetical protein POSPLADRAFT_1052257 [Postia placenta MAD-698-R-SB12]|uniref:leucyl aminopeptidase n=1 Tax=Postia placenta MAD-698-R-SB12 TaxID=670580 RepID=A0A1X6NI62_9APHY|nr:hypothetical protein POSPLADRAFT_1052257 [Postia placenta MAD-698-R-SB12]OSX68126.1 hypothetical protein POSPLADRAFT_1052257 [Postia placenta MAD-698-R-SB12]